MRACLRYMGANCVGLCVILMLGYSECRYFRTPKYGVRYWEGSIMARNFLQPLYSLRIFSLLWHCRYFVQRRSRHDTRNAQGQGVEGCSVCIIAAKCIVKGSDVVLFEISLVRLRAEHCNGRQLLVDPSKKGGSAGFSSLMEGFWFWN